MKYLSPEELGLSLREYGALLGVRGLLATGMLKHKTAPKGQDDKYFNMADWHSERYTAQGDCGTAMCIGGTMNELLGLDPSHDYHNTLIDSLMFPGHGHGLSKEIQEKLVKAKDRWAKITVRDTLKAIDNFLTTGKPKWDKVLGIR